MQKDMSPEEKLLALIKGKHKGGSSRAQEEADPEASKVDVQDSQASRSHIAEAFRLPIFKNKVFDPKILRFVNNVLVRTLIVLILYFVFEILFVKPRLDPKSLIVQPVPNAAARQAKEELSQEVKDYSHYSNLISSKRLFAPPPQEDAKAAQSIKAADDIALNLGLVGIIQGDNPQAVIEDKKLGKTYYVTKGQTFDGFSVEEIESGKVVLDYAGKKIMLVL